MASIKVLLKSDKNSASIYIRLIDGRQVDIVAKTKYCINAGDWSKAKEQPKDLKDIYFCNLNYDLIDLKSNLLKYYNNSKEVTLINTKWLKEFLDGTTEILQEIKIPKGLVGYIDFYIDYRKHELKPASISKFNVIKHKMQRLEKHRKKIIYISDINDKFKNEFVDFYKLHSYAQNTMQRELVLVKTFCKHARFMGLETHSQLDSLKLERGKVEKIYLSFEELKIIDEVDDGKLTDSLKNARDWLIISCYCGQRVSDFLQFKKSQIRIEKGKSLIEFTQKKTKKLMTVPLHKEILKILKKRDGDFPYEISDQKYNDYIKKVCEIAELNKMVYGSKNMELIKDSGIFRKKSDLYKKFELVSSHIGRRSFATNFYGTIPTTYLIYVTGHSTEGMFLSYIGKSNKDIAMEITKYF
jgi:integrase